jgi:hypothetical protein
MANLITPIILISLRRRKTILTKLLPQLEGKEGLATFFSTKLFFSVRLVKTFFLL